MTHIDKQHIDYTLYLVTDRSVMSAKSLEQAVEQAIQGGCTVVQLREKNITSREFFETAQRIILAQENIAHAAEQLKACFTGAGYEF